MKAPWLSILKIFVLHLVIFGAKLGEFDSDDKEHLSAKDEYSASNRKQRSEIDSYQQFIYNKYVRVA